MKNKEHSLGIGPVKPPAPLIQVNAGFGIGGMRRETAGGNNGSRNPWEEGTGTDWKDIVRKQVFRVPKELPVPPSPAGWEEVGLDDSSGRFRIYLKFHGIRLPTSARFMTASRGHYLRPDGSDSAVYARLPSGILVLSTHVDIIEGQLRIPRFPPTLLLPLFCPELQDCDPTKMGISVLSDNLVVIGYGRLTSSPLNIF